MTHIFHICRSTCLANLPHIHRKSQNNRILTQKCKHLARGDRGKLYTGVSCYRVALRKHSMYQYTFDSSWLEVYQHTVQKSGVQKAKLMKYEKKTF